MMTKYLKCCIIYICLDIVFTSFFLTLIAEVFVLNNNPKNRILIVVSGLSHGGAQRVAANLSLGMREYYEVDLLVNDTEKKSYPYYGRIIDLGLKPTLNKRKLSYQIVAFFKRFTKLRSLKNSREYVAVLSFLDSANIVNILTGDRHCKTILSIHSRLSASRFDWRYRYIVFPAIRLLYSRADKVVTVSEGIQDDLQNELKYKNNNVVTIYNGFDIEGIRKKAGRKLPEDLQRIYTDHKIVISVGRLCKAKGYWHLIRAMKEVISAYKDCKLVIVGVGEQEKYLKELVKKLELEDYVFFAGFRDNPYNLIKSADLFVMSSIYEGLPSAMIEALAIGTPCVSTDFNSGAREILAPGIGKDVEIKSDMAMCEFGILTPVCDGIEYSAEEPIKIEETVLAKAIIECLSNESIRKHYSEKSAKAVEKFNLDVMARNWHELLV